MFRVEEEMRRLVAKYPDGYRQQQSLSLEKL